MINSFVQGCHYLLKPELHECHGDKHRHLDMVKGLKLFKIKLGDSSVPNTVPPNCSIITKFSKIFAPATQQDSDNLNKLTENGLGDYTQKDLVYTLSIDLVECLESYEEDLTLQIDDDLKKSVVTYLNSIKSAPNIGAVIEHSFDLRCYRHNEFIHETFLELWACRLLLRQTLDAISMDADFRSKTQTLNFSEKIHRIRYLLEVERSTSLPKQLGELYPYSRVRTIIQKELDDLVGALENGTSLKKLELFENLKRKEIKAYQERERAKNFALFVLKISAFAICFITTVGLAGRYFYRSRNP